jgi:sugar lactone lactonase YvrE
VNYHGTIPPIHWYHHSSGEEIGTAVAGGVFAENSNYPDPYANAYFYADVYSGWVHVLELDSSNNVIDWHEFDTGLGVPVSFANGADGNIYVVGYGAGVIYKYVYTP